MGVCPSFQRHFGRLIVNVIAELFTFAESCNTHALSVGTHMCLLLADCFGAVQVSRVTCWICPTKCFELSVVRFHLAVVEPPTLNITCLKNNVLCQLVRDDACFICQSSELASCGSALWRVLLTADETSQTFSGRVSDALVSQKWASF